MLVSPYMMHRDVSRWERPHEFVPERWLSASGVAAARGAEPITTGARWYGAQGLALCPLALAPEIASAQVGRQDWRPVSMVDCILSLRLQVANL